VKSARPQQKEQGDRFKMKTSNRVLNVLNLFTSNKAEWTVEEAAKNLDLKISTAYRYFRSLSEAGLIINCASGRYMLGPAIIQFDRQIRIHDHMITIAQPEMVRIARDLGHNIIVLLTRLYRAKAICVHQETIGHRKFATSFERGRLIPLYRGAASKVILANLPGKMLKDLTQKNNEQWLAQNMDDTAREVLRKELKQTKSKGYCIAESEVDEGLRGIAVPLFLPGQSLGSSLSIVTIAKLQSQTQCEASIERLISGRKSIEAKLALINPSSPVT